MKLSDGEKLILVMLSEIYVKLGIKGDINPEFVKEAVYGGHSWGLKWQYSGVFDSEDTPRAIINEVCDVLDMWWMLEVAYDKLGKKDKQRVASEVPFGKDVKFRGFDGNNETKHMSVASFLVDHLDRFTHFAGRDLNSHMPSLEMYDRMVEVFKPKRQALANGPMNVDDIIAIMKAAVHPSNR